MKIEHPYIKQLKAMYLWDRYVSNVINYNSSLCTEEKIIDFIKKYKGSFYDLLFHSFVFSYDKYVDWIKISEIDIDFDCTINCGFIKNKAQDLGNKHAFPNHLESESYVEHGMSKRFYAACSSLQGILSNPDHLKINDIVSLSYSYADELLKQE